MTKSVTIFTQSVILDEKSSKIQFLMIFSMRKKLNFENLTFSKFWFSIKYFLQEKLTFWKCVFFIFPFWMIFLRKKSHFENLTFSKFWFSIIFLKKCWLFENVFFHFSIFDDFLEEKVKFWICDTLLFSLFLHFPQEKLTFWAFFGPNVTKLAKMLILATNSSKKTLFLDPILKNVEKVFVFVDKMDALEIGYWKT